MVWTAITIPRRHGNYGTAPRNYRQRTPAFASLRLSALRACRACISIDKGRTDSERPHTAHPAFMATGCRGHRHESHPAKTGALKRAGSGREGVDAGVEE